MEALESTFVSENQNSLHSIWVEHLVNRRLKSVRDWSDRPGLGKWLEEANSFFGHRLDDRSIIAVPVKAESACDGYCS